MVRTQRAKSQTVGCYYLKALKGYCRRRYLVKVKLYNTQH